jgi:hypothetical protein
MSTITQISEGIVLEMTMNGYAMVQIPEKMNEVFRRVKKEFPGVSVKLNAEKKSQCVVL